MKYEAESPQELLDFKENIIFKKYEYDIIKRYYYDDDYPTLEDIADEMNFNVRYINKLKANALARITKYQIKHSK